MFFTINVCRRLMEQCLACPLYLLLCLWLYSEEPLHLKHSDIAEKYGTSVPKPGSLP